MTRLAGPLLVGALALYGVSAHAQAGAAPPIAEKSATANEPAPAEKPGDQPPGAPAPQSPAAQTPPTAQRPPTSDDICRTVEQAAAANAVPVEFFARVIWQESRFNALAVSNKGAEGIAQFMPQTAGGRGLADPFDPIQALRHSASYLHDLVTQFGNLGLAAASYNAGPGRVSAWLAGRRGLPGETRAYVRIVTGRSAEEWAGPEPPKWEGAEIPKGVPCAQLVNLVTSTPSVP